MQNTDYPLIKSDFKILQHYLFFQSPLLIVPKFSGKTQRKNLNNAGSYYYST